MFVFPSIQILYIKKSSIDSYEISIKLHVSIWVLINKIKLYEEDMNKKSDRYFFL